MPKSTTSRGKPKTTSLQKPKKPNAKFPLTPHASGKWMKKVGGKIYYFGNWAKRVEGKLVRVEGDGVRDALKEYDRFVFTRLHGREPVAEYTGGGVSVGKLCNLFLESKQNQLDAGELSPQALRDYTQACDLIVGHFGGSTPVSSLGPYGFEKLRAQMATSWGPTRLGNFVVYIKGVFKYGFDMELLEKPLAFGPGFSKPSAAVQRKHRAEGGERLFTPAEIHELLNGRSAKGKKPAVKGASIQMRAMILLGINCGFGNTDVATLPLPAINWKEQMIDFPRPKNGIERKCSLWPETVKAIKAAIHERPQTTKNLTFVTRWGNPWMHGTTDAVGLEFGKLLKALHINGRRSLGFYSLRHTFQTVSDESLDFPAISMIMGHAPSGMSARYRERIDDKRLKAVSDHVRKWLFNLPRARKAK
jgi:integrase